MEDRPNWLAGRRPTSLTGAFARTTSDSGSSLGSPSPAAKPRWNTDYAGKLHTRASSDDLTEDENTKPSYSRPQLSPNSRRLRNQELMKRALAAPPIFVNRGQREKPTFASANRNRRELGARVEQTTRELARKSSMSSIGSRGSLNDDDQPLPPPNVPKAWGSRAKKQPHWIRKILSPDLPGSSQEDMDVLFKKPHATSSRKSTPPASDTESRELTPPASRPASVQPRYAEKNRHAAPAQNQYEDDDYFTGAGVQSEQQEDGGKDHYAASMGQQYVDDDIFTEPGASARSRQQHLDEDSFSDISAPSVRSQQDDENDYYTRPLGEFEQQDMVNIHATRPASLRYEAQTNQDAGHASSTDDQFTSQSIEVSQSPAIRVRTTLLDEIREREIETLSARAVATSRLGEIRERNSEERDASPVSVRRFSRSPTPSLGKTSNLNHKPEVKEETPYDPDYKTILEEDGYPIPGTPVWVMSEEAYQKKTGCGPYVPDPEGTFETLRQLSKLSTPQGSPVEKESKEDEDTQKVEQKLEKFEGLPESVVSEEARISNGEPAPQEQTESAGNNLLVEKVNVEVKTEPLRNKILDVEGKSKRHSTSSDIDPEDRITAEAKLFELQDKKSERNSWSAPPHSQPLSPTEEVEETPKPSKVDPMLLPTPRVMGAYIETPAFSERKSVKRRSRFSRTTVQSEEKRPSSPDSSESEGSRTSRGSDHRSRDDSPHPESTRKAQFPLLNTATIYSAAEDVRQLELAAGIADSGLEDSTLEDFAATMEQNPMSPSTDDRIDSLIYNEAGLPLTPKQRQQKLEMLHYERMSKRLHNTSSGIRQTTRGISRITKTISDLPDLTTQPTGVVEASAQPSSGNTPKSTNTTKVKFGVESEIVEMDFNIDIKWSNFFWKENSRAKTHGQHGGFWSNGKKFTWIGYISFMFFLFATWFVAETATCSVFCRPRVAYGNSWSYDDPTFPYAIPTKLDQWTGSIISSSLSSTYEYMEGLINGGASFPSDPVMEREAEVVDMAPETGSWDDDEVI